MTDSAAPDRANRGLQFDEEFARFAVERMPAALSIYDAQGALIYCNPMARTILGLDDEEMKSRSSSDERWRTIHEDGSAFVPDDYPINVSLRTGSSCHEVAMGIVRNDDTVSWMLINSEPIFREGNNRPIGVVAIFIDITERVNLKNQLYAAQKLDAIGKLSGGVAHDLRNILQVINTSAEILIRSSLNERAAKQIDVIRKATARGADLTQQLLAVGRLRMIQPSPLDLREAIASSVQLFRPVLGDRIEVTTAAAKDLWLIHADSGLIGQVVMNIVLNARDAMPDGGSIHIELRNFSADAVYARRHTGFAEGDYVLLTVTDTGCGIPAEIKDKIFDPYFSTKTNGGGHAGLGLAVVYGIVQQQRGHIWVYSEPGKGTSFKIFFPRYRGDAQASSIDAGTEEVAAGHGETILLVDDDDLVRDVIGDILELHNYSVIRCAGAEEAIAAAGSAHVDLLLTDVAMRSMTGFDLAQQIPDVKVIYMSGYTDEIHSDSSLGGEIEFLEKPVAAHDLLRAVRAALDRVT